MSTSDPPIARCPNCEYDLAAHVLSIADFETTTCPECGHHLTKKDIHSLPGRSIMTKWVLATLAPIPVIPLCSFLLNLVGISVTIAPGVIMLGTVIYLFLISKHFARNNERIAVVLIKTLAAIFVLMAALIGAMFISGIAAFIVNRS